MRLRSASKPKDDEKPVTKTAKSKSPATKKESKIVESSKKIQKKPKEAAKAAPAKKKVTKKKVKKEPAPKPEPQGCGGCPEYTPDQQKLFEEKWKELIKLTFVEIKGVISKFWQPTGGPKTELTLLLCDFPKKELQNFSENNPFFVQNVFGPTNKKRYSGKAIFQKLSKFTLLQYLGRAIRKGLTDRAADIYVLGRIGSCPSCKHGIPRFDVGSATYYCPGWSDDHWFNACKRTLSFKSVVRTPLTADEMK